MSQQELPMPAAWRGAQAWGRQLDAIKAAVNYLGPKEVAWELNIGGTHLSDALKEAERKCWHASWTHVVKAMLSAKRGDGTATGLLRAIVEADIDTGPFALVDDVPMTVDEQRDAALVELERFGDAGKEVAKRIRKGRRR